ncbi:hypothetical protein MTR_3g011180 [Medicago truncatula]|uniref:Uncharacterized protein n=1 Tax=Medicago truncatula TaxID=3880 RepID=G7IVR8_MEDTR|nr:hypothetical protein MTR_3g011180 [Medicago truncatula]
MNADDIEVGRIIAKILRRIAIEGDVLIFGHCSIINGLCEGAGVKSANNDLPLRKANTMDVGSKSPQGVELEEVRKPRERYDNLALSMANAMVEMSKAICPCISLKVIHN